MKTEKEILEKVGKRIVRDGLSEEAVIAEYKAAGVDVTPFEARRAAYEETRRTNPFAAASIGSSRPEIYRPGSAIEKATADGFDAARAHTLARVAEIVNTVAATIVPAPAAGGTK